MEICEPEDIPQHRWLKWVGLQEPPLTPDSWVPVARSFKIDEPSTGSSKAAARLIELLAGANIEAQQRSYRFATTRGIRIFSLRSGVETHIAVGVHNRDLARATEIASRFQQQLAIESNERQHGAQ
jgi:hypothetical protein